jgi:RNA polymerase primary sigma factor
MISPEQARLSVEAIEQLEKALGVLPERHALVLRLRFGFEGYPLKYREIARAMSISPARVSQIEHRAILKLRKVSADRPLRDSLNSLAADHE